MKARRHRAGYIPGYTRIDGFKWCIDCIEKCCPGRTSGLTLAGETMGPEPASGMFAAYRQCHSVAVLRTHVHGKLPGESLTTTEAVAPKTVYVQADLLRRREGIRSTRLQAHRKFPAEANSPATWRLEFEGKAPGVMKRGAETIAMLRKHRTWREVKLAKIVLWPRASQRAHQQNARVTLPSRASCSCQLRLIISRFGASKKSTGLKSSVSTRPIFPMQ